MRALVLTSVSVVLGIGALGCGARSDLERELRDAGPVDAPPPECVRDGDCDDGVACTQDRCVAFVCAHRPDDGRCDDGLFCTGGDRCDATLGCVTGGSPCDDGVDCTEDVCDELLGCGVVPDADRCPLSHRCDPVRGCVARALVHDTDGNLFEVDLPGGEERFLAATEMPLTDVALHPDGRTFALSSRSLFAIDERDGAATFIGSIDQQVALDVMADGALVSAGRALVRRVDPETVASEVIGRFPPGFEASGDIAFVRGRMLVTGTTTPGRVGPPDVLFEVPGAGATLVAVGSIGFACVWALAPFGDTLYGLDCMGQLLEIDPDTGAGRRLAGIGTRRYGGAAAR